MVVSRKITHATVWIVSWTSCFFTEHHFYLKVKVKVACSVMPDSLQPHGLYRPWNSPGQNTGVDSLSFLQGIFPAQGLNPGLMHCRQILYQLNHKGSPFYLKELTNCGYSDLCLWPEFSQKWTKWASHFKGKNWEHLLPMIKDKVSNKNENFGKL